MFYCLIKTELYFFFFFTEIKMKPHFLFRYIYILLLLHNCNLQLENVIKVFLTLFYTIQIILTLLWFINSTLYVLCFLFVRHYINRIFTFWDNSSYYNQWHRNKCSLFDRLIDNYYKKLMADKCWMIQISHIFSEFSMKKKR